MNSMHIIDISLITLYFIICVAIGLKKFGKVKNITDYTIGGSYSTMVLAATLFATYIGAGSILGNVEKIQELGVLFAISALVMPLSWIITSKIFANHIEYFKDKKCISVTDIMEVLYGNVGKWVTNILSAMFSIGILSMQITALGYLLHYFLDVPQSLGAILGFGAILLYSLFGGVRSVVFTDVFQTLVLLVGIPAACFAAYYSLGGYTGVISRLPDSHISIEFSMSNMLVFSSLIFYSLLPSADGAFVQRFLMAQDQSQLKRAITCAALLFIPFTIVILITGFVVTAKMPEITTGVALFELINNHLPVGAKGLVIIGLLSAIMSTADSYLNTAGVLLAHNIIKEIFPKISDSLELKIARVGIVVISLLAVTLSITGQSLSELMWCVSNFWYPFIVVPLIAGFLKFKTNSYSFVVALFTGGISTVAGGYIVGDFDVISTAAGMIGSAAGLFAGHLAQGLPVGKFSHIFNSNMRGIRSLCATFNSFHKVHKAIINSVEKRGEYYYLFGIFGMSFYLLSSLAFHFVDDVTQYNVMWLRIGALFICTLICMHELYIPQNLRSQIMPVFWHIALCYCLPFLSIYTLLVSGMDMAWIIGFVISEILLYIFVGSRACIILSLVGYAFASILFACHGYQISAQLDPQYTYMLVSIYGACTIIVIYTLRQKDLEYKENVATKLLYSGIIAHEMRNPMAGAYNIAEEMMTIFNKAIRPKDVNQEDFEYIKSLLPALKETSANTIKTIDRTLNNVRTDIAEAEDFAVYDVSECIFEALSDFVTGAKNQARIQVLSDHSFKFQGSKHFVKLVIANLVNNALRYAGRDAHITIRFEKNSVYIKDDGLGISHEQQIHLFRPFNKMGSIKSSGMGLAFCSHAMRDMKGSLNVISELGRGSEFILKFPKI